MDNKPYLRKNRDSREENRNFRSKKSDRPARTPVRDDVEIAENLVIGRNAVMELLASGRDVDKLFVQNGPREGSILKILGEAAARHIPVVEVEKAKLDRMAAGGVHQGVVAAGAVRDYDDIDDIFAVAEAKGEKPFIILLDGVEDPHNLGAIIRSAVCSGAHGVVIPKRRAVGLTATVAKASAGALAYMKVARVTNLSETIEDLKSRGIWFYAADMGGTACYDTDFSGGVGLVLGNEGDGISRLVKEKCDLVTSVPLYGEIDSMNVSCAAAVLMAEVARQRHTAK